MTHIRPSSRRPLLAVPFLLWLLFFTPALQSDSEGMGGSPSVGSVCLRLLDSTDGSETRDSEALAEVRALLAGPLSTPKKGAIDTVRATLRPIYGDRLTETSLGVHYKWVFLNGEWVLVCFLSAEFRIDLSPLDTVVVEACDSKTLE
jgi:hypothetical protein